MKLILLIYFFPILCLSASIHSADSCFISEPQLSAYEDTVSSMLLIEPESFDKYNPEISFMDFNFLNDFKIKYSVGIQSAFHRDNSSAKTGSPERISQIMKLNIASGWTAGFCTDKDAGEINWADKSGGYLSYSPNSGIIQSAVAGDYKVKFGHGLLFSSGVNYFSSAINAGGECISITPYCGPAESNYLRGIAVRAESAGFTFLGFFSNIKLDSGFDSTQNTHITIDNSGLHRTDSELKRKNTLVYSTFGMAVNYSFSYFQSGILFRYTRFLPSFRKTNKITGYSAFISYKNKDCLVSVEYPPGSSSFAVAAKIFQNKKFSYFASYLHLKNNIPFGSSFWSNNAPVSLKEFRVGFKGYLSPFSLRAEYCVTKENKIFEDCLFPLISTSSFYNLIYKLSGDFYIDTGLLLKHSEKSGTNEIKYSPVPSDKLKLSIKFHFSLLRGSSFETGFSKTLTTSISSESKGFLFNYKIRYNITESINLVLGQSFYSTDTYDSALFGYEGSSPVMYNGEGISFYLNSAVIIPGGFSVKLKYNHIRKLSERSVMQTEKSTISFQADYSL